MIEETLSLVENLIDGCNMGCLFGRPAPVPEPTSATIKIDLGHSFLRKKGSFRTDYNVVRILGPSSNGNVLEVENKVTNKRFAMKTINKSTAGKTEFNQLLKELEVRSQLSHPHLIKITAVYKDKLNAYVLTEVMEGGELFDFIVESGTLTEPIAAAIFKQLLSALFYCHQKNIVLRNISPENILLEKKPERLEDVSVKLVDFDESVLLQGQERLHKITGSEAYLAPEIFSGEYGLSSDIWSLGVLLYIMLSGFPPFSGDNSEILRANIQNGSFDLETGSWEGVSEEAKDLIRKMLVVNPKERLTASQALTHAWLTQNKAAHNLGSAGVLLGIKKFQGEKRLKQALQIYITDHFGSKESARSQVAIFEGLDKDSNGLISRQEMIGALANQMPMEDAVKEVDKIMLELDTDGSSGIDFEEFKAAVGLQSQLTSKKTLESAFGMLDQDASGSINVLELQALLGDGVKGGADQWTQLIAQADKNGDGKINLKEFTSLLIQP